MKPYLIILLLLIGGSCVPRSNSEGSKATSLRFKNMSKTIEIIGKVFSKRSKNIAMLHKDISNLERIKVIEEVPVSEIMSAPGHLRLRNPDAVKQMAKQIEEASDGGRTFVKDKEKIVLNVATKKVVSESGEVSVSIRSIEVVDGNHRLAAGFHAQNSGSSVWKFIKDIPQEALEIRVNGERAQGAGKPVRWIPLKIFESDACTKTVSCREFREGKRGYYRVIVDDRGGQTVEVDGSLTSIDDVIPDEFKGRSIFNVMQCSLVGKCDI